ncbi:PREDICTED: transcription factor bHLH96-like [Tarenaya hassleriana]|uniref:transcription factor bHLH96-like n=1 Tax=Tarenaya hassleriana TaxID=28532 RepID=UPI00053C93C9|nr:PREDICTED: transcription factor bHLH96-like [Tarenaya hassleriana]
MALEAVVFQQDHIFGYNGKDLSSAFVEEEPRLYDLQGSLSFLGNQTENFDCTFPQDDYCWSVPQDSTGLLVTDFKIPNSYSSNSSDYPNCYNSSCNEQQQQPQQQQQGDNDANSSGLNRAKRRRSKTRKNKEEIENQRMTHIAVERNRRKQMNEYLSVLRSLMPESYVQRGDQASIVGGAINFVRELEHRLHRLSVHGDSKEKPISGGGSSSSSADPFSDFFKFPQFSTGSCSGETGENNAVLEANALADIEVSLIESHASLKIRTKRRPKLLLNVVSGLQTLGFIILHLNVSTADDFVLYCFSTKVEDDCKLTSVADIATAVYQMLCLIHQHEVVK